MEKYIGRKVHSVKNLNSKDDKSKKVHCLTLDDGTKIHSNDYKLDFADFNIYITELNQVQTIELND